MPLSSEQQRIRRGTIETNNPIYAKKVAYHALEQARTTESGQTLNLITTKVFLAFMMEGIVDHLGRTLDREWDTANGKRRPRSRSMNFYEKHKFVRKLLGMSNGNADFRELTNNTLAPLFSFRDSFAHPKKEVSTFEHMVTEGQEQFPVSDWETTLTVEALSADYQKLDSYCRNLLSVAADLLEQCGQNGMSFYKKYPHLGDSRYAVSGLRIFWNSLGSGSSNIRPYVTMDANAFLTPS